MQVNVNPEQSVPPSLNLENDTPSSNKEVPIEDMTIDAPDCSTEVPKEHTSATAKDTVTSFPTPGMHARSNRFLLWLICILVHAY
jgi:hypothetical protein